MADIGPVGLARGAAGARSAAEYAATAAPKESRYGKVWVGGIEEARGMAFRRVFVPGINEGLFPRPPAEDPLLLEVAARGARHRIARGRHGTAAHRRRLRVGAADALLLAARPADRARARAVLLRVRGASRGRRARRSTCASSRIARAPPPRRSIGWPAPREPGRRDRRRRVRSRHARAASPGLGTVSEAAARPRRRRAARALDALAQAVEGRRRPDRSRRSAATR